MATAVVLFSPFLAGCAGSGETGGDGGAKNAVWFEEAAADSGIDFHHRSGFSGRFIFPEIMGGGAALFDMDGDGDLDAYLVQSGNLGESAAQGSGNRLYVNRGDGTFDDVTEGSGTGDRGYGMGVAAGDYDNDGDVDLYVTNYGPNVLLQNDGKGTFSDVTRTAKVGDASWSTSAAFLDYDNDGDLDLFVANYVNWTPGIEQDCYNPSGGLSYCLPTNYNAPATDRLYRNDGQGQFTDVTVEAGLQTAFGNGLGVVAADFDGDGWIDLFVANDTMMNQLWINEDGQRFRDEALLRGCAVDEHGVAKAGMGVAVADLDDDLDLELVVANLEGQSDSYYRNEKGFFTDHTGIAGLASSSRQFTRFGIGLEDFDNDGLLDLFEANGRVIESSEPITDDPFAEPNVLFRGVGPGAFEEILPRGGTERLVVATSRAAAFGDVNGDGAVDVLVVNRDAPAHLFLNVVSERGNWLVFSVRDEHGRDAIGARVTFSAGDRRVLRDVRSAFGYCSSSDPRIHVGLGEIERVEDVQLGWPDGTTEAFGDFDANRVVVLRRGEGHFE